MDTAGNLYGTTDAGGANGYGTVFKISASGTESILYSFGASSTDGTWPQSSGLIMDSAGNLYGTTYAGGANGDSTLNNYLGATGYGTVFKISASGVETVVYSFGASSTDGKIPLGLIMDSAGNLYGTTDAGGANRDSTVSGSGVSGAGTVFKIE
jgi:uncharacterized repeat protein (TIGR03803 family)